MVALPVSAHQEWKLKDRTTVPLVSQKESIRFSRLLLETAPNAREMLDKCQADLEVAQSELSNFSTSTSNLYEVEKPFYSACYEAIKNQREKLGEDLSSTYLSESELDDDAYYFYQAADGQYS